MSLYQYVKVTEGRASIAHSCIRISHIERTNELAIINQLHLLVVPLEELRDTSSEEVHAPVREGIVANHNAACILQLLNKLLIRVVVQVVDD